MNLKDDNLNNGANQNNYNQNYYNQGGYNLNGTQYGGQYNQNTQYNQTNQYNQNAYTQGNANNNSAYNYNQANQAYNAANAYMAASRNSYAYQNASGAEVISESKFNLILGGCLFWGFLVNCILCSVFADSIVDFAYNNGIMFFISYFVLVVIGNLMVTKSDNPAMSFVGYNLIVIPVGMVISMALSIYVAEGYASIIPVAFGITAAVTLGMMLLSSIFPAFFSSNAMGKTLFITLLLTIVIEFILFLTGASLGIIDYLVVLLFCGYIGYDWARANEGVKTVDNAVDAAAMLYVDMANLFLRILRILARAQRN